MTAEHHFREYVSRIEHAYRAGNATEHTYRPALKTLLEQLNAHITATNEPKRVACGAPDYVITTTERSGPATIGYLEAKDIGVSLNDTLKTDQLARYRRALENLVLTDYLEFRWFIGGEHRMTVRLAEVHNGHVTLDLSQVAKAEELLVTFLGRSPEQIRSPKDLAQRMARLTHMIRDLAVESFAQKAASDMLKGLYQSFKEVLIPDLSESDFADMFAQTLAYGLFAARSRHTGPAEFRREYAAREIPRTNPFLRRLFGAITGPDLEEEPFAGFVDDLTQLLARADMEAILADFGRRTRQEDPIVHFYETFLTAYDPKLRELRGVYYTPEPVVSYIVRSVDAILKCDFGLPDGLADSSEAPPLAGTPHASRVLLLDPACGTGTFLYKVIDLIRERFAQSGNEGMWSGYVGKHLLPRLFGFELLMAPYAMAHLKLGMQLAALDMDLTQRRIWAYDFSGDERLGVFLTNTLDEAARQTERLALGQYISDEANEAAAIKRDAPVMVVLGNPPYSNFGQMNTGDWIRGLLNDYKEGLNERKINLDDDYIKFIRFGQWRIERTGQGVLAFITNNGYLDGITHRRMRQSLLRTFSDIYILNLHGSVQKRERNPDGSKDENVFDIRQGVAIALFVKKPNYQGPAKVRYADIWGVRNRKYDYLTAFASDTTEWLEVSPSEPQYFFVPKNFTNGEEYKSLPSVTEVFPNYNAGIQTKRDHLVYHFTRDELERCLGDIATLDTAALRDRYALPPDGRDWTIENAQVDVKSGRGEKVQVAYHPFDKRWTLYTGRTKGLMAYPRRPLMENALKPNLLLLTVRNPRSGNVDSVFAANSIVDKDSVSPLDNVTFFPLYLYPDTSKASLWDEAHPLPNTPGGRSPNLAPAFTDDFSARLGLSWVADGKGDRERTFGPEDVFSYLYAVFHSPEYRERYAEFLKTDFPRLPLTRDADLFRSLSALGDQLVGLHLMERRVPAITRYPIPGDNVVEKVRYTQPGEDVSGSPLRVGEGSGRVWINATQYVEGVPPEVWEFHVGGYQVCEKWLKDRKGRTLSYEDLSYYQQVVSALAETIRLMAAIDDTIEDHGGWPLTGSADREHDHVG